MWLKRGSYIDNNRNDEVMSDVKQNLTLMIAVL